MKNIVVLTGAGISAESGISTFRDQNGLWEQHAIEEVASPEGFAANPELVHHFYNVRRRQLRDVEPNPAHHALARLEREWRGGFLLVSQNVDDLHARAGSKKLLPIHGALREVRCQACERVIRHEEDLAVTSACADCGGKMRPHIVWFGEVPLFLEEAYAALADADLFIAIGTSGHVYPAAGFVGAVPRRCRTIEINPASTTVSRAFQEHRRGPAGLLVPVLVEELLKG